MKAGRLDRRITLQRKVQTKDALGAPQHTWEDVATVWSEVREQTGKEVLAAGAIQQDRPTVFVARYLAGVLPKMRVVYDGSNYDIASVREIGRRSGMEIVGSIRLDG